MGEMSEQSRKLVGNAMPENTSLTNFTDFRCGFDDLERLIKASYQSGWNDREDDLIAGVARVSPFRPRTEGRGDEPVAKIEDGARIAYRLGYQDGYVDGRWPEGYDGDEREAYAEIDGTAMSDGWQNLRETILSQFPSPIREPEISREALIELLADHFGFHPHALMAENRDDLRKLIGSGFDYDINEPTRSDLAEAADAILNLAPVGLKADFTKALPGGALDDTTFGAVEDALDRADAPMQAENGRWLTLPERIAALALERPKAFQDCDVCGGDCVGANPPVNACPRLLAPVGGRGEEEPGSFSVTGENGWRPEVRAFADLMEAQLRDNDHKPGWKNDTDLDLFERLGEESAELLSAIHRHAKRVSWGDSWVMEDTVPRIGQEAADVANFAMMIADVCGALPPPPQEQGGMK